MKGFTTNIEKETLENNSFRKVLYTAKYSQLVLMSLKPKEEIGMETHENNDQFFRFESGHGKCIIDGNEIMVTAGDAVVVPAGAEHNVINTSEAEALKLYTIYSPPMHQIGLTATHQILELCSFKFLDGLETNLIIILTVLQTKRLLQLLAKETAFLKVQHFLVTYQQMQQPLA